MVIIKVNIGTRVGIMYFDEEIQMHKIKLSNQEVLTGYIKDTENPNIKEFLPTEGNQFTITLFEKFNVKQISF